MSKPPEDLYLALMMCPDCPNMHLAVAVNDGITEPLAYHRAESVMASLAREVERTSCLPVPVTVARYRFVEVVQEFEAGAVQ